MCQRQAGPHAIGFAARIPAYLKECLQNALQSYASQALTNLSLHSPFYVQPDN
jgi:hypothetical protein